MTSIASESLFGRGEPMLDGAEILIVEDQMLIALGIEGIIQSAGGKPVIVRGFDEAQQLRPLWPRLSLCIANPPGASAEDAATARAIRDAGVTFIISSADSDYDPSQHGLSDAQLLAKPFTEEDVLA